VEIKEQKGFGSAPAAPDSAKAMPPGVWVVPVFLMEGLEKIARRTTTSSDEPMWVTDVSPAQEDGFLDPEPAHQDHRERD
jgi:hypothetical protein